jgi:hypothetical protein
MDLLYFYELLLVSKDIMYFVVYRSLYIDV